MTIYKPVMAMREHMLAGNEVTILEAMLLFGVQNPNAEFVRLRKEGFMLDSRPVSMAAVVRRINEYATCKLPDSLPYKEINFTEYWIKR